MNLVYLVGQKKKQTSGSMFEPGKEEPTTAETMEEKKKRLAKTLGQQVLPTADNKDNSNKKANIFGDYEDESGLFNPSEKKDKTEKKGSIFGEDEEDTIFSTPKSPNVTKEPVKEVEESKKELAEPEETPTEKMKKRMAKLGKNMFAPDLTQEFKKKSEKTEKKDNIEDTSVKQETKARDIKSNNLANLFGNDNEDILFPSEKSTTSNKNESEKILATTPKTDALFSLAPTQTTKKK